MDEGYKKIQRRVDDALNTVFKRLDVLEYPQRERDARKAEHEAKQREESAMQRQKKRENEEKRDSRGPSSAERHSERAILLHGKIGDHVGVLVGVHVYGAVYSEVSPLKMRGRPGGR